MEVQYIVAIATGSLFGLMVLIGIASFIINKSKDRERKSRIYAMYHDSDLARIDYDLGLEDDNARMASSSRADGQLTIEDVLFDGAVGPVDEGMEEITGNYKPD